MTVMHTFLYPILAGLYVVGCATISWVIGCRRGNLEAMMVYILGLLFGASIAVLVHARHIEEGDARPASSSEIAGARQGLSFPEQKAAFDHCIGATSKSSDITLGQLDRCVQAAVIPSVAKRAAARRVAPPEEAASARQGSCAATDGRSDGRSIEKFPRRRAGG